MGSTGRAFMEGVSIGVGYHLADRMARKAMNRERDRIRREKEKQQRIIDRHNYKMKHNPRYRQNYIEDQHQHTLVEQHRHSLTQPLPPERRNANNPFMF